jgi:hypothetical protein
MLDVDGRGPYSQLTQCRSVSNGRRQGTALAALAKARAYFRLAVKAEIHGTENFRSERVSSAPDQVYVTLPNAAKEYGTLAKLRTDSPARAGPVLAKAPADMNV